MGEGDAPPIIGNVFNVTIKPLRRFSRLGSPEVAPYHAKYTLQETATAVKDSEVADTLQGPPKVRIDFLVNLTYNRHALSKPHSVADNSHAIMK